MNASENMNEEKHATNRINQTVQECKQVNTLYGECWQSYNAANERNQ